MTIRATLFLTVFSFVFSALGADDGIHLFVLSGQSNMAGHRPAEAFTPAIEKALGKENVIIIQDAQGGQPIYRWFKEWKSPQGEEPANRGDLYDRLMSKVKPAIEGKKLASVTFFWMQGERDAKMACGDIYGAALQGLYDQFSDDIGVENVRMVIGRLSDFDMGNQKYPHWTRVREAQVALAEGNPLFDWVDTDDLNDGKNRGGKPIKNDLHYSGEGYITFGKRMAEKSLALLKE
jgi:hypothetical protein